MGSGVSKTNCPKCTSFKTKSASALVKHLKQEHKISCTKCGAKDFKSEVDLNQHWETQHATQINIDPSSCSNCAQLHSETQCPNCDSSMPSNKLAEHLQSMHILNGINIETDTNDRLTCPECKESILCIYDFVEHIKTSHTNNVAPSIRCPKCDSAEFDSGEALLDHLQHKHLFSSHVNLQREETMSTPAPVAMGKKIPKVGDRILAMWGESAWQYFDATILKFDENKLKYEIEWDDGDTTGRIVDYYNIAVNKSPEPHEIGIGSIILFGQGKYVAGQTQLTGGLRWHQGEITSVHQSVDGTKLYNGNHTKGNADGKFVTYKGYSYQFTDYKLEDLRIGPNVFDIVSDMDNGAAVDDIDTFFSYTKTDSPDAIRNNEVQIVPDNYKENIDSLCDPRDIVKELQNKDLKVMSRPASSKQDLKSTAQLLKKAKVVVACISDQYVKDEVCRMEFQYAKTTLKKPVVPLVVGCNSFEWTFSVIGLLIAGELYIHFKSKEVQQIKTEELLKSLNNYFQKVDEHASVEQKTDKADVFISYCWTNSLKAKEAKQIEKLSGNSYSDPRKIKDLLEEGGFHPWLDIERLKSANADSGLFDQLTKGIMEAKVIVPFISDEYASSANCRMEFQFALKSLGKPVVPVIVGSGDSWMESVVGALISTNDQEPVNLQNVVNEEDFNTKLNDIKKRISAFVSAESQDRPDTANKPTVRKSRAPKVGDHVVCHHFKWAYYMATVVSYDCSKMEYTVNWDDGDPSGRVQPYNQVALDIQPDRDDIGVGSHIFFPQGGYGATEGNNSGGVRYHEGIVTKIRNGSAGKTFVCGHHSKGEDDGKGSWYQGYAYEFKDILLADLRMAPTALDAQFAN